jgi:hypothetical protein
MMRHLLILGLLAVGPAASADEPAPEPVRVYVPVYVVPGPAAVTNQANDDLLMYPSRETSGAQRLGSTEINNPPHESFGMAQMPDSPDLSNIRKARTGAPVVSGAQAKENAAEVHADRRAAAGEAGGLEAPSPQQAAAQAATAQAAGVTAAISSAKTSAAAAAEGAAPSDSLQQAPSTEPSAPSQEPPSGSAPADAPRDQPAAPGEQDAH